MTVFTDALGGKLTNGVIQIQTPVVVPVVSVLATNAAANPLGMDATTLAAFNSLSPALRQAVLAGIASTNVSPNSAALGNLLKGTTP